MGNKFADLRKFIEFAYTDLTKTTEAEKEKLLRWLLISVAFDTATIVADTEKNMPVIQRNVLGLLKHLDQAIMIARTKNRLHKEKGISSDSSNCQIVWAESVKVSTSCVVGTDGQWDIPFDDYQISTTSLIQDHVSMAIEYRFFIAADRLPVEALRSCPECKHFFIHMSKKLKTYCSNTCAAKAGSRKKRAELKTKSDEEYDQELRKGAKRARKSYVKKVQAGNPKVRVESRPTKHKPETED